MNLKIFRDIPKEYFGFRDKVKEEDNNIRWLMAILYLMDGMRVGKFKAAISAL